MPNSLEQILSTQRQACVTQPLISYQQRITNLKLMKAAVFRHQQALIQALSEDYGYRSHDDSMLSEILPVINNLNYSIKSLKKWMKPSYRRAGIQLFPAKLKVVYQALGVVGIIVPWNFPVMLSLSPLISVLAAGNRAMLKLSEFTPATNQVLRNLLAEIFEQDYVAVIEGEQEIAAQFSTLEFDHLLFTGSTAVGKQVMRAAADNLTPITLELGGKSPVLVAPDMPIATAIERMIYSKTLNAGQICLAADYVLCPEDKIDEFIHEYQKTFQGYYPEFNDNPDYGLIINDRQYQRVMSLLADAKTKGAKVFDASGQMSTVNRKLATQLITSVTSEMAIMKQEIFGPLLPIISYKSLDEAIHFINNKPTPLAIYLMSFESAFQKEILHRTRSGAVCFNESLLHVIACDAPFGGLGQSGMGHYHGQEGFRQFSHGRTILSKGRISLTTLMHPPYGKWIQKILSRVFIQ